MTNYTQKDYERDVKILADAPEDKIATHYDGYYYWKYTNENGWSRYSQPRKNYIPGEPLPKMQALSDIRALVSMYEQLQGDTNE